LGSYFYYKRVSQSRRGDFYALFEKKILDRDVNINSDLVYFSFQSSRSVIDFWSIAFCYSDDQQVLLLLRDCLLEASDNDLLNHFRVSSTIPFSLVDRLILIYKDYDNVRERLFYLKGVYDECDSVEAFPYVKPGFCSEAAQDNDITTS
jgi:hypothetical protein